MNNVNKKHLMEDGQSIIDFDTNSYNFYKLVLDDFNKFFDEKNLPSINKLSEIHKNESQFNDFEGLRQRMFSLFRGKKFQEIYCKLGKEIIDNYYSKNALIQKTPTARIQPPQYMTTSFHCDAWYGHSELTTSFWVPLTKINANNTLYMAKDRASSKETLMSFENNNYDLGQINDISKSICEPVLINYGQIKSFAPDMIHGAVPNTSNRTRVTFDFRIVSSKDDLGHKSISNYYDYNYLLNKDSFNSSDERMDDLSDLRLVSYSNSCRGVNAKSQLTLCAGIAQDRKINITRNESEIYVFSHLPVLRYYLGEESPEINGVIAFSLDIFENDISLAKKIFELALKNNKVMLFAAEDILIRNSNDLIKAINIMLNNKN